MSTEKLEVTPELLREARKKNRLRQKDLAVIAGVSAGLVSQIEQNRFPIADSYYEKLQSYLKLPPLNQVVIKNKVQGYDRTKKSDLL